MKRLKQLLILMAMLLGFGLSSMAQDVYSIRPIPAQVLCSGETLKPITILVEKDGVPLLTSINIQFIFEVVSDPSGIVPSKSMSILRPNGDELIAFFNETEYPKFHNNKSNSPIIYTFRVIPYTDDGGNPISSPNTSIAQEFSIVVNPEVKASHIAVNSNVYKNGDAVPAINFTGTNQGSSYEWKRDVASNFIGSTKISGLNAIPPFIALNPGISDSVATYHVWEVFNGCKSADSATFDITVEPYVNSSALTMAPIAGQTLCSGDQLADFKLTAKENGTVITNDVQFHVKYVSGLTTDPNALIDQVSAAGANDVNFSTLVLSLPTFANVGTSAVTYVYSVTPIYKGVEGIPALVNITVNPRLQASDIVVSGKTYKNGDAVAAIAFTGTLPGATYEWKRVATSNFIGSTEALGLNTIPAFTAVNPGETDSVATYNVWEVLNGCKSADSAVFKITVTPYDAYDANLTMSPIGSQVLCTGGSASPIILTAKMNNDVANITGAIKFHIKLAGGVTSDPNAMLDTVLTVPNNNFSLPLSGISIANVTGIPQTYVYSVTPIYQGKVGVPTPINITVNPKLQASDISVSDKTYKNGDAVAAIAFTGTLPGATYEWKRVATSNFIGSTEALGLNAIPAFTAVNPGTSDSVATYNVWEVLNGCKSADSAVFKITVTPYDIYDANLTMSPIGSQVLCTGGSASPIILTAKMNNDAANITGAIKFHIKLAGGVTSDPNAILDTVLSVPNNNFSLPLSGISIANVTGIPQTYVYSVTPIYQGKVGVPTPINITVNPKLQASDISVSDKTYKNGDAVPAITFTGSLSGATYEWKRVATSNFIGSAEALGLNAIPAFTAVNPGTSDSVATYNVWEVLNGCKSADSAVFTITVEPKEVFNSALTMIPLGGQELCSGTEMSDVNFTARLNGTVVADSVKFHVQYVGGDNDPNALIDTIVKKYNGESFSIMFGGLPTFHNVGNVDLTYVYQITPIYQNMIGVPVNLSIRVKPAVKATHITVSPKTYKNGDAVPAITFTGSLPGATYEWERAAISNFIGSTEALGLNTIPAFTAVNPGTSDSVATYNVWEVLNGCKSADSAVFTITVKAKEVFNSALTMIPIGGQELCSGTEMTDVNFTARLNGTVVADSVKFHVQYVSGNNDPNALIDQTIKSANGDSFKDILVRLGHVLPTFNNVGTDVLTFVYQVTPIYQNMIGVPVAISIKVKPRLQASDISVSGKTYKNGDAVAEITFNGKISGASYEWERNNTIGVSVGSEESGLNTIPSFVASNIYDTNIVATYNVWSVFNGCKSADSAVFTITVNPYDVYDVRLTMAPIAGQTLCSSDPIKDFKFTALDNNTIINGDVKFAVKFVSGSTEDGNALADTVIKIPNEMSLSTLFSTMGRPMPTFANVGTSPVTYVYSIIPHYAGRVGVPVLLYITVNPRLQASDIVVNSETYKNGDQVSDIVFTGKIPNAEYQWVCVDGNVGTAASGSNILPAFVAVNETSNDTVATFKIWEISNGCQSTDSAEFTIRVTPHIVDNKDIYADPIENAIYCAKANFIPIPLTAYNKATQAVAIVDTFELDKVSGDDLGLVIINDSIQKIAAFDNTIGRPLTATYRVTPRIGNSLGNAAVFTVTVNPEPKVDKPQDIIVCSGIAVPAFTFTGNVEGGYYKWDTVASSQQPTNTVRIPNLSKGQGDLFPGFTLLNTDTVIYSTKFIVTPVFDSCKGTPQEFTITVNPQPIITSTVKPSQSICSGTAFEGITVTTNIADGKYDVTLIGGVDVTASAGTIIGTSKTGTITGFNLTNTGKVDSTGTYRITPKDTVTGCAGVSVDFTLTVKPLPQVSKPADITVCSGTNVGSFFFEGNAENGIYSWQDTGGVGKRIPTLPLKGDGAQFPAFQVTNTDTIAYVNTYKVTPSYNGCVGTAQAQIFTITVNPQPIVTSTVKPLQSICSGTAFEGITVTTNIAGGKYDVTLVGGVDVTKGAILGTSKTGNIIGINLTNTGKVDSVGTYRITPKDTVTGCAGVPVEFTLTAKPLPQVSQPDSIIVCSGTAVGSFFFEGNAENGIYSWQDTGGVGKRIPTLPLQGDGAQFPAFQVSNTDTVAYVNTYEVTPSYNGCVGTSKTFKIQVNPEPKMNAVTDVVYCAGVETLDIRFTGNSVAKPDGYAWRKVSGDSIGILAANATNISEFAAFRTSANHKSLISAIYEATPYSAAGCSGNSVQFKITVLPRTTVDTVKSQIICNGGQTLPISFDGDVAAATYAWSVVGTSKFNLTNGVGNIPSLEFHNLDTVPLTDTILVESRYPINAAIGGFCMGDSTKFTITVNPTPTVNKVQNFTVINEATVPAEIFAGKVQGTHFTWTNDNPSIGLVLQGIDSVPSFVAKNTSTAPVVAHITATPSYINPNGGVICYGEPMTYSITVNPKPGIGTIQNQVVCNGEETKAIDPQIIGGPNSYITWTGGASIGLPDENGSLRVKTIPAFVANNDLTKPNELTVATIKVVSHFDGSGVLVSSDTATFTYTVKPTTLWVAGSEKSEPTVYQEYCQGETLTMAVAATGWNFKYQWYHNDLPIPEANDSIYVLEGVTSADGGIYYAKVQGDCGPVLQSKSFDVMVKLNAVKQSGNLGLVLVTTPQNNGGFDLSNAKYQWYVVKSGVTTAVRGANLSTYEFSLYGGMDITAEYYVTATLPSGKVFTTCPKAPEAINIGAIKVYPNPVLEGEMLTIDLSGMNLTEAELQNVIIQLASTTGQTPGVLETIKGNGATISVRMPYTAGSYVLRMFIGDRPEIIWNVMVLNK